MGFLGIAPGTVPPNEPPEWSGTPTPSWVAGVGGTYDLKTRSFDPEGEPLTYTLNGSSAALPTGVTLASNGVLTATGSVVEALTGGVIVDADDGVTTKVASPTFSIEAAAAGTGKRFNPGHYLKVQGQPADSDQFSSPGGYQTKVFNSINTYMDDDPLILGCHVGVAWGVMNPTGSTFDWDFMDAVIDLVELSSKRVIFQLQNKSFNAQAGFEAPADLEDQIVQTGTGWLSANWRDGTGGFPDMMARYMAALEAIGDRYDSRSGLEIVLPVESAQSFGSFGSPADYTDAKMATQLDRMYTAAVGYFTKANFAPNLNSLGGTGGNNKIPELMERIYQLGLLHGGPDAKATIAYNAFEGTATGPVPVTRDYRNAMGAAYAVSEDVLGTGPGDQGLAPATVITQEQDHETTHLSWIPGAAVGPTTWTDVLDAINADPLLHTACPTVYASCDT